MLPSEGGSRGASYNHVAAQENLDCVSRRLTFELPPNMCSQLLFEGSTKGKEMEIDSRYTQTKAARPWALGKCIPQASLAPKYIISSPRIEEQKQYMQDYAPVDKFLGIWPLKCELIKWIQQWWKPKSHYDLQLGTKGFFTIILHNIEDRNRIFDRGPYFFNSTGLFFPSGRKSSALKQRILCMH